MPQAMPPLYQEAELEMNFPSSAAGRVDGTGDEEARRPPTSTSAQMDELQETSRALPVIRSTFAQRDATELEMTLMNGSDSGVATDATNQPQVARHQSNKAHRYMYTFGVLVLVLIGLCLVTNAYLEGWGGEDCGDEIPYCDWHENPCLHSGACQSKGHDSYTCLWSHDKVALLTTVGRDSSWPVCDCVLATTRYSLPSPPPYFVSTLVASRC